MTRRHLRFLPALLIIFMFTGMLTGCKQLARLMPAKTIDAPTEGTPEWVVYKFIEGSMITKAEDAWAAVRPLLHSSVVELSSSERSFTQNNFPAFRRKLNESKLYTTNDKGEPHGPGATYKLDYVEEDQPDKEHRLFIVNKGSDMPSPFRIARDPNANNQWRIKTIP